MDEVEKKVFLSASENKSHPPKDNASAQMIIALAAAMDPVGFAALFDRVKYRGSRTHCAQCEKEIPPGRPGRRCETCRGAISVG